MKKTHLNAVMVERLFGIVIVLLLVSLVFDFIFVTNFLRSEANRVEDFHHQAELGNSDIANLKSTEAWLRTNSSVVDRTNAVVAQSKLYQYQNQIIEDINTYASRVGIPVSGYTFTTTTSTAPVAAPAPAATSSGRGIPGPVTAQAPTGATAQAPTGVNSITVTVIFGNKANNNVDFQSFLSLLRLIEQNVTRMQVTTVSLTPDTKAPSFIAAPSVTIIVYTNK